MDSSEAKEVMVFAPTFGDEDWRAPDPDWKATTFPAFSLAG